MWGDVGHGEALFGDLSKAESCHLLGRSRALAPTLTPSGSDLVGPCLEAGGSSIPVLVKPTCVCATQVPVVGIMATGGGARAMTSLYGHLLALQKLDLLDCVTYFSGISGSTW